MRIVDFFKEKWTEDVHAHRGTEQLHFYNKYIQKHEYCAIGFALKHGVGLSDEEIDKTVLDDIPNAELIWSVNDSKSDHVNNCDDPDCDGCPEPEDYPAQDLHLAVEQAWNGWTFDELKAKIEEKRQERLLKVR